MNLLIYGSYGYTGRLVATEAVRQGLRPVLAGRDPARLEQQARELGLESRPCSLDKPSDLDRALDGMAAVLHCAGPFSQTSQPMAAACLRHRVHYLDITGEIAVFEALARQNDQAIKKGITLLPGVGFDVVPSDCLAAHLKQRLPSAQKLSLAFKALSRPSQGTMRTTIEGLSSGGKIRQAGQITAVPSAWKRRQVDFGRGPVQVVTIPWGDVSTAYYSTGIPNIETYLAAPAGLRAGLSLSRYLQPVLRLGAVRRLLQTLVKSLPEGPNAEERTRGLSLLWGEVADTAGNRCISRMRTPEGYQLTAQTAVSAARKVLSGRVLPGFQTPSLAFGADFILEMEGVIRKMSNRSEKEL
jgi:short subunit dehydrogenase-like uncharacterized protein